MRVLDLGCGIGESAAFLAEEGLHVLGLDFSPYAIDRARRMHAGVPRLEFDVVDVTGPGPDRDPFDALVDFGCLHTIPEEARAGYGRNVMAWSKPGTRFLLLMRFGAPLFEGETAGTRNELVRSLFVPEFEIAEVGRTSTARPDSGEDRPALVYRLVRTATNSVQG